MGQQISDQTQLVLNKLPEKVAKHVTLVRESGSLTYEEFLGRVAELNDITAKVASGQEKHLLFEVQPGSDSSAFWKVVVRVVCTKINKSTGIVEASRIMNLYQFIQLYKDITSQASGVLAQSSTSEDPDENSSSVTSCQASLWMGRVKQLTDEEECCICMDGRADLILPCAHSFCQKCIDKWFLRKSIEECLCVDSLTSTCLKPCVSHGDACLCSPVTVSLATHMLITCPIALLFI
ncbi:RING finger protein 141 isoform X1 [Ursus maritimus]|uniref:RING finger protein 141 n=1 Tax=Ursus maritimus TaxID=29073 RepID=A0A384BIL8_URSMA|nr:RING finger protein 141 isoform X1 [Ursus maritimus]XP_008681999.1 RING finger protein 141 isoform X1 [Ursus maritimus]XP_008682000.1 RING finger protein 141 isoform X1 [Ursus maritimus]XP_008682001.1 RING finger protein 141 isoform X1 [Ursus maritimus]XP_008682002.1 RING finger protein 141 isoform X1 [Ursus maritimus]